MKNTVTIALLLFVAASVAYLIVSETTSAPAPETTADAPPSVAQQTAAAQPVPPPAADPVAATPTTAPAPQLIAYYFHGHYRCNTCRAMERYAKEAIEAAFADDLAAGHVEWHTVNFDEPANEHFIKDYGLTASAVVLVRPGEPHTDRRMLDQVWNLIGDEAAYKDYVIAQVRNTLEATP